METITQNTKDFEVCLIICSIKPNYEREIIIKVKDLRDAKEIARSLKKYNAADFVIIEILNEGESQWE